jgi:hypothetical protein
VDYGRIFDSNFHGADIKVITRMREVSSREVIKKSLDHRVTVDVEFNWRQNAKESRERIAEKYGPKLPAKLRRPRRRAKRASRRSGRAARRL